MANKYRAIGARPVLGNDPGSEFEHEFASPAEESEHLRAGRLEIVPRLYQVVGPRTVHGAEPGGTFTAALPMENEQILIDGGHIERAGDAGDLLELSRPELNEIAKSAGVENPEKLPNKQAVADAITAATTSDEQEGSE